MHRRIYRSTRKDRQQCADHVANSVQQAADTGNLRTCIMQRKIWLGRMRTSKEY